jgi:hypothetical protein
MVSRLNRFLFLVAVFLSGGVVMLALRPPVNVALSVPSLTDASFNSPSLNSPSLNNPSLNDRPVGAVPATWSQFGQLVQDQFKALLEANDDTANRFRLTLKNQPASGEFPPGVVLVQVWVGSDGKVTRLEFPSLQSREADADLRAILEGANIGRPPSDMPQPLRLKLAPAPLG